MKGRKITWGNKISETRKNGFYNVSEETRRKISLANKGSKPWNKGLKGYRSGEKNNKWKGGITPLIRKVRNCIEYKEWRKMVYQRDFFRCVLCHAKPQRIDADHYPKGFVDIWNECDIKDMETALSCAALWDISNGRTLCWPCHRRTENYGRSLKRRRI